MTEKEIIPMIGMSTAMIIFTFIVNMVDFMSFPLSGSDQLSA